MDESIEQQHDLSNISNYKDMILSVLINKYRIIRFADIETSAKEQERPFVIFRHDVDFCIRSAVKIAEIENEFGLKTTYFFHLRSPLYNLLSSYAIDSVNKIFNLGHDICLHFDMLFYGNDFQTFLLSELELLRTFFPFCNTKIVSFHRRGKRAFELNSIPRPAGIEHTYLDKYFSQISYHSDSGGLWKRGNPVYTNDCIEKKSMQILTHPMWWCEDGDDRFDKLNSYLSGNREQTIDFLENTVISYPLTSIRRNI